MKKITLSLILACMVVFGGQVKAQINEELHLSEFDPYMSAYMKPFASAMAVSMSGGWAHTAEVHSLLGFDITFNGTYVKVPSSDYMFNPQELDMPGYTWDRNSTPTISGSDNQDNAAMFTREFNTPGVPPLAVDMLTGMNLNFGGMASLQAAIGLPKGTELIVRYVPNLAKPVNNVLTEVADIELAKTGMWGLGVKHDIKQWIPVVSKVPFLQMSVLMTYSKFNTGFSGDDFRLDPERLNATSTMAASTWDGQKFDLEMSSFTGSLLIGASIPVFQPFIGIGFNNASFEGGFKGNYPVISVSTDNGTDYYQVEEAETDPINLDAKVTNFNFQAGARLKLGFFVFHYQYTMQKYSMHNAGLAFTFR